MHGGGTGHRRRGSFRLRLLDIDAALEQRTIFDADARRNDVPDQLRILADIDFVGSHDVTLHLAEDDDFPGAYVGLDAAIRADGDFVLLRFDGAFDIAIDVEVFLRKNLTADFN